LQPGRRGLNKPVSILFFPLFKGEEKQNESKVINPPCKEVQDFKG
jgi:hypothetical protein